MIVVSDSGPILYLHQLDLIDLLPRLFGKVIVPQRLLDAELLVEGAPHSLREFLQKPMGWLDIRSVTDIHSPSLKDLGLGEQQAIMLAGALNADLLLCDDRRARAAAERMGLAVTGTLGVLVEAAAMGWISFDEAARRLMATNFRHTPELIEHARQIIDARPGRTP